MLVKGNHKIIWIFLLLGGSIAANAQQASILMPLTYSLKDSVGLPKIAKNNFEIPVVKGIAAIYVNHEPNFFKRNPVAIRPDYYTSKWGIFCEGEWRLEKKTGIPIRVRLGSLEYVDRLEGKDGRGMSE